MPEEEAAVVPEEEAPVVPEEEAAVVPEEEAAVVPEEEAPAVPEEEAVEARAAAEAPVVVVVAAAATAGSAPSSAAWTCRPRLRHRRPRQAPQRPVVRWRTRTVASVDDASVAYGRSRGPEHDSEQMPICSAAHKPSSLLRRVMVLNWNS